MFISDNPISSKKEDNLGRFGFSKNLAEAILKCKEKDSLVIGLFGEWGCGKTSIINMSLEHIEETFKGKKEKPVIVKFNPWNYSDQNQLIAQFFKTLLNSLGKKDLSKKFEQIGKKLQAYAKIINPLAYMPGIAFVKQIAEDVGKGIEGIAESNIQNLDVIKNDLNDLLTNLNNKIIIVIDDIDRLNNIEIRQIFQLIKSLADFQNTIYLLSFDKNIVIKALENVQTNSGLSYLEKIIQINIDVPSVSISELDKQFIEKINEVVEGIAENRIDHIHFANIYYSGIKHFFNNIRDVKRYINSIKFYYEQIKNEVNTVDFIAITAIQIFRPSLYNEIKQNKEIFTGSLSQINKNEKEIIKSFCDKLIQDDPLKNKLKELLIKLFPKLDSIFDGYGYGDSSLSLWRKECRICSPDIFDIYFTFALASGDISNLEIQNLLTINDSKILQSKLINYKKENKTFQLLDRLSDFINEISGSKIQLFINSLIFVGDILNENDEEHFLRGNQSSLLHIVYNLLRKTHNSKELFDIYKNAVVNSENSIYTIIYQFEMFNDVNNEPETQNKHKKIFSNSQIGKLREILIEKLEKQIKNKNIFLHDKLVYIMFCMKRLGIDNLIKDCVTEILKNDRFSINFITGFLIKSKSLSLGDYAEKVQLFVKISDISELIDVKQIEPRIRKITCSSSKEFNDLNEKQKLAIKTFIDVYDGKIKDEH